MHVWLTRSEPGASRQAAVLEAAGHRCLVAPVLYIESIPGDPPPGPHDVLIFLSEHAVRLGLPKLRPGAARIIAVGARTAEVLEAAGHRALRPERPDSEGLLALPQLAEVRGQRIMLVCGAEGRTLLATELAARGAQVEHFVCYRRRAIEIPDARLGGIDAIVAGSADGLAQIARLWFGAGGAPDVAVLVPSARVRAFGVALGFRNVHDCQGADAAAVLRGLERLARTGAG